MAKYAWIKNADDSIERIVDYDTFDAQAVSHKFGADKEFRIIPVIRLEDPVAGTDFDASTHRLGQIQTTVTPSQVERVRTVEPIPQEQIDDRNELDQIRAVYQDLRNGVGTATERLQRVERVLARVMRDNYGS